MSNPAIVYSKLKIHQLLETIEDLAVPTNFTHP
ncbi:hypothetical protein AA0113_g1658 [Alternaria arborescens]|uniref:Uncharacterized protein n=1 Tax=Alternaria arborescens TaxID=156630 RepID=A0A4V1X817_9PLEO|nr:hypothetical protein AA0111_g1153 [Alternaria arborescens]RYN41191.1 hypothetical protein AA0112_g2241 [Alternaria arborescens]RYO41146.1 hypothetical protein AA0111_g1153 [Alternaria arborescens]RYO71928.1 hypothetical protein AA0113_g1658 [Alternaria arborescens]